MKVSGFTIARNAIKYNYPIVESIRSILPVCDEFIVNVGDSEDATLKLIESIDSPKIRIIQNTWDMSQGKEVLSYQTNLALKECKGDWAFYLQSDEVIHEGDLPRLKKLMNQYLSDKNIEAFRFQWFHFYGSYFRYRIDKGWFQKQDRIIRNNGEIESFGDAYAFQRKDGKPLRHKSTGCFLYHYGWVHSSDVMAQRRLNAEQIGFATLKNEERAKEYSYGDLNRFVVYFGTHPCVMKERVDAHKLSQKDWKSINRRFWWNPAKIFRIRYKTGRRVRARIEDAAKKILISNIFGIGDVLFTTALISNIKDNFPDCFIGYVCNKRTAPLLAGNPKINKIIVYEKDEFDALFKRSKIAFLRKIFGTVGDIKREKFDFGIEMSLNKYASFLLWFAGIKERVGFNYKNRSPFLTKKIPLDGYEKKHVVEYYLDLLESMGFQATHKNLELFLNEKDRSFARDFFQKNQLTRKPVVVLAPGGGASWGADAVYKRWPADKYAQLADKLIEKFKAQIILLGSSFEKPLCRSVASRMQEKNVRVCCEANITEAAAVLEKCDVAIVNDGGLLHVAVAVGTKTVSIFGPVDEKVYGPYPRGPHRVVSKNLPCQPCYRRFRRADCTHYLCLHSINVSDIIEKVDEIL